MGIRVVALAALLAAVGSVFGAGSIVSSFLSPCSNRSDGMCYCGGYLYIMDYPVGTVYRTTTNGSVLGSWAGPRNGSGVHFTGTHFWTNTYSPGWAYYRDSNGSILASFAGPAPGYGITSDGTYLWYSCALTRNTVWQLTTTGSVIGSFGGPGRWCSGLDWDPRGYLWVADAPYGGVTGIYRVTTNGSVVESYSPLPVAFQPVGCAWDGSYVWYCDFWPPLYVYQMDTVVTSVEPASIGKVKALFR